MTPFARNPMPINAGTYSGHFPYRGGMPMLPPKPNPLTTAQQPVTTPATAEGIANMRKLSAFRGLSDVPSGAGPQQMAAALTMLNQARALADPAKSLENAGLSRSGFESTLDRLADQPEGQPYNFSDLKYSPRNQAILGGLVGGAGIGGLSHLAGNSHKETLNRMLIGGALGAGTNYFRANKKNKNLLATAKILNQYGLNRPEYLRQALPLLKESDERPTPSESKMYKFEKNPMAFGQDAVDSLSPYMKQAGLNPFQTQFFSRLMASGLSQAQIQQAVKAAGDRFGPDVQMELNAGLEKLAFDWDKTMNSLPHLGLGLGRLLKGDPAGLPNLGLGLGQAGAGATKAVHNYIQETGKNSARDAVENSTLGQKAKSVLNGMPDIMKQLGPYLMLGALGGGGGAMAGGGGGAALGGLGLPLLMYLMMNQQGKATPFDGLGSMFGNMFGMNNQAANKPPDTNPGAGANTASAPPANTAAAPATTQPANTPPATPAVKPPVPPPPPAAPAAAAKPPAAPAQGNTDYNATPVNPEPGSLGFKAPRPNFSPMKLPVSGRMMS